MAKTTFRVDRKRWGLFDRECKASFLRRDAYLNHILPSEIGILEQLSPNTDEAHQWLKSTWFGKYGQLRADATDFVSVMLDKPLIDRLSQTCDELRIPRDAFLHCALMFLTERLFEAALVVKDPRTKRDTFWGVAQICHGAQDEDEENRDGDHIRDNMKIELLALGLTALKHRNLGPLRPDYYERELSFPPEKLAEVKKEREEVEKMLAEIDSLPAAAEKDNKCL